MSEENFSTDSTNFSNKEKENIISQFVKYIKYEYIPCNETQNEKNEFKEPDHELNWNYSDNNTYHFKQDIERVWIILRSFEDLLILCSQGHYPCIFLKGKDTWTKGNEFKGNIFGKIPFIGKVRNCSDLPEIKKVEWIIHLRNQYIFIIIELFKVTEDNSTIVIKQIKS